MKLTLVSSNTYGEGGKNLCQPRRIIKSLAASQTEMGEACGISRMYRQFGITPIILAFAACSPSPDEIAIRAAEQSVRSALKDPDSAKFSAETVHQYKNSGSSLASVCGLVNAKNAFGGYSGNHRFYAWVVASSANAAVEGDEGASSLVKLFFNDNWQQAGCNK